MVFSKSHYIIGSVVVCLILLAFVLINYWSSHDVDSLTVEFDLSNIKYFDESDEDGGAEPYLWTAFFKIDGDTVVVNDQFDLEGTASVFGTPGNQGNLGDVDVEAGDTVPIPDAIGKFETVLKPIPVKPIPGITVGGVVGVIAVLIEQGSTPEDAVAEGHKELNETLESSLNELISGLSWKERNVTEEDVEKIEDEIRSAVKSAIVDEVGFWDVVWSFLSFNTDQDGRIGTAKFFFSHKELEESAGKSIPLIQSWSNEYGKWEINGSVTAVKE